MERETLDEFEHGVLVGLLIGQATFTTSDRAPLVSVKLTEQHRPLLDWLAARVPGTKVYGPYHYQGTGQRPRNPFCIWHCRARAFREVLVPLLDAVDLSAIDPDVARRYARLRELVPPTAAT